MACKHDGVNDKLSYAMFKKVFLIQSKYFVLCMLVLLKYDKPVFFFSFNYKKNTNKL